MRPSERLTSVFLVALASFFPLVNLSDELTRRLHELSLEVLASYELAEIEHGPVLHFVLPDGKLRHSV